ncbi:MAG: acriflavin resistance protein [Gammaproteobacteria bacterium]|nr:MAG: acriflavin resistance protein [Gammaproteobacteria bacterium]TND03994.1 MAG: acriflavin resistance protein [Gammaproteobacteria bacterium]
MSDKLNIAGRLGRAAMSSHITPLLSLVIFLVGLVALFVTPREENPQIDVPTANVSVSMPGATVEEILNLVVRPMEMVLREMPGVDHTFGMALDSLGIVTVQFNVGEDKEASLVKLYDRMMHNLDRIPPGASEPLVKPLDVDDVPIVAITLSSDTHNELALKELADRVREQLAQVPGVSVLDVIGGRNRQITVEIDPARLEAHEVSLTTLHKRLGVENSDLPTGYAVDANRVKTIRLKGALASVSDIENIVVAARNNRLVYLSDVADIRDGVGEIGHVHRIGFGGASKTGLASASEPEHAAVTLTLAKKRGTNAVAIAGRIRDRVAALQGDFIPDDVMVTVTRDSGAEANAAVNMLIEHLGMAIASVIVILLVFLGWREASIVTLNIPLILFIVLAAGLLADQTINRITLFALILSLGLLVDDAIVVVENIHRHLAKSLTTITDTAADKARVIIEATNETGPPTIMATLTVILAFIPMAFVTGMMGPYMGPIPFNVPVAMLASLIIAYMLTPWIALRWLPVQTVRHESTQAGGPDWLQRLYTRLSSPLFDSRRRRTIFFAVTGVLMMLAMWQVVWQFVRPAGVNGPPTPGTVELKMLPKADKNTFNITIDMPEGTPLEITDAVARDVGNVLRRQPVITDYETYVGIAGPVDFNGMLRGAVNKRGMHVAEIRVNLVDKRDRRMQSEDIVLELRRQLEPVYAAWPDANIKLVEDPPGPPVRATFLAEVYGPDYDRIRDIARRVRQQFSATWDVVDHDDSVGDDQIEYRVMVDKEKAALAGVDAGQLGELMRNFVGGHDIGKLQVPTAREPVPIRIQMPRHFRIAPRDFDRLFITNDRGDQIPAAAVARIEEVVADRPIYTKDMNPVAYVSAEPATRSQVYPLLAMDAQLDGVDVAAGSRLTTGGMGFTRSVPDNTFGYQLLWDGEMRLTLDVFRDLGAAFIVALVLIYLLLVAYYGGFILPLIVMGAIPLTMIGIFPGHWITQQPFTATSMIGMIALAGIVVRNSLLLIDFILAYRAQGASLEDAVREAGAVRARPILLTALAIIAGSSILIMDPVFGGLGVSMAFGTLASTVLTLFVIPLIYYLWQRRKI